MKQQSEPGYEGMRAALMEICRLSNEFNEDRNWYASKLEDIARAGLPSVEEAIPSNPKDFRMQPCWQPIGEVSGCMEWRCRECSKVVSRGCYPTHLCHANDCSYSAWPIIERAEKAEAELAALRAAHETDVVARISHCFSFRNESRQAVATVTREEWASILGRLAVAEDEARRLRERCDILIRENAVYSERLAKFAHETPENRERELEGHWAHLVTRIELAESALLELPDDIYEHPAVDKAVDYLNGTPRDEVRQKAVEWAKAHKLQHWPYEQPPTTAATPFAPNAGCRTPADCRRNGFCTDAWQCSAVKTEGQQS